MLFNTIYTQYMVEMTLWKCSQSKMSNPACMSTVREK